MRSNYTDLLDHFTLKSYSPITIIWSTSAMQHPLIDCSSKYVSALLKEWRFSIQDSKLESFEWDIGNGLGNSFEI